MIPFATNYKRKRPEPLSGFEESITQQHLANDCNINTIMARYQTTGTVNVDPDSQGRAIFGDFSLVPDYQTALNSVRNAEAAFATLPSSIREKFGNDYSGLLAFVADEKNKEEAIKLGLIEKPAEPVLAPEPKTEPKPAATPAAAQ